MGAGALALRRQRGGDQQPGLQRHDLQPGRFGDRRGGRQRRDPQPRAPSPATSAATVDFNLPAAAAIATSSRHGRHDPHRRRRRGLRHRRRQRLGRQGCRQYHHRRPLVAGGYTPAPQAPSPAMPTSPAGTDTTLSGNAAITSLRFNVEPSPHDQSRRQHAHHGRHPGHQRRQHGRQQHHRRHAARRGRRRPGRHPEQPAALTISSNIVDNTSATGLTKSAAALLVLSGIEHASRGPTYVNGGTLQGTVASLPTAVT